MLFFKRLDYFITTKAKYIYTASILQDPLSFFPAVVCQPSTCTGKFQLLTLGNQFLWYEFYLESTVELYGFKLGNLRHQIGIIPTASAFSLWCLSLKMFICPSSCEIFRRMTKKGDLIKSAVTNT